MRFATIKITKETTQSKGIEEIDMQRLSSVVVLVGKNGSGKTRILDLIEANLFDITNISVQGLIDGSVSCLPKSLGTIKSSIPTTLGLDINSIQREIDKLKQQESQTPEIAEKQQVLQRELIRTTRPIQQANNELQQQFPRLQQKYLKRVRINEIQQLQEVLSGSNQPQQNIARQGRPQSSQEITFETLIENISENVNYNELNSLHKSSLGFFIKLPHQLVADKHECLMNGKELEKRTSHKRYRSLQKFVKDLLKKDLTWESEFSQPNTTENGASFTVKGTWKLNNRPFNYAEFSEGERILFTYALLFFLLDQNPNLNIRESIILIDEPELHLHPDSEIDLIDGIRNVIKEKGQLIIATHSINILSMLNYDEIFMVKDGAITPPSQATPGKSLSELMSIEQRVNKLTDFLSSISTWAYVNFITQCFADPEIIATANQNDPQMEAFKKAIKEKSNKSSNMLLDFGAGKGRLYQQFKFDNDFADKINYCALEPNQDYHADLKNLGVSNIYKEYIELPQEKFDFILLCNVLHEIPLEDWEKNLNAIINSLKSNGYLLIIEAKYLTKGEKIGKIGYLLLDKEEIKELFSLSDLPTAITVDGKEDIITCIAINKSILHLVSQASIKNALQTLENNTLEKIEFIRENEYSSSEECRIGRKMAFLSQQHINAKIAQKYLKNKNS